MQDIEIQCENTGTGMLCIIPESDPYFTPFYSSGDIMISILLLLLLVFEILKSLRAGIGSVKTIKKMQGNNSMDGKEFYEL